MGALLIKSFNFEATCKRRQMTLVETRLIAKLFKQLIKREVKKKKVNQIGYRLQLMYGREGETPPNQTPHACLPGTVCKKDTSFLPSSAVISSKPGKHCLSAKTRDENKSFVSWGKKKILKKKKKTRCCHGNSQHTRAGRTACSLCSPFSPRFLIKDRDVAVK